jgi:putative hemin transport protein
MNVFNATLRERYQALKDQQPQLRIRDAAQKLHTTELELLELDLGGQVIRLRDEWKDLLPALESLGKVMALTRNDSAVHERKGVYQNVSFMDNAPVGLVVNEDIDLRLFMQAWQYGYAVRSETPRHTLYSFQFFDAFGEAIHKVYLQSGANPEAYQQLIHRFRAEDQATLIKPKTKVKAAPVFNPAFHRTTEFQAEWLALRDTHDFYPLLRKYDLCRTQALRLAPEGYALRIDNQAAAALLEQASRRELPIMVFVGNNGCIQIHTGPVRKLAPMEGWINIMDPDFNLHLRLDGIQESWITRKPTDDGIVTGLELFDAYGEMVVQFFGARKPGKPELSAWRELTDELASSLQLQPTA